MSEREIIYDEEGEELFCFPPHPDSECKLCESFRTRDRVPSIPEVENFDFENFQEEVDRLVEQYGQTVLAKLYLVYENEIMSPDGPFDKLFYLLEKGLPVDSMDIYLNTPLFTACIYGLEDLALRLIEKGANVNSKNFTGESILYIYCRYYRNSDSDMVKILLDNGADPNCCNSSSDSALCCCFPFKGRYDNYDWIHKIELLLKYGANPYQKNEDGEDSFDICSEIFPEFLETYRKMVEEYYSYLNIKSCD